MSLFVGSMIIPHKELGQECFPNTKARSLVVRQSRLTSQENRTGGGRHLAFLLVAAAVGCGLGGIADGWAGAAQSADNAGTGRIRPYSRSSSYWQYQGKPLLLFGGSDRDNIFHWAGEGTRLTHDLDLLAQCGGNYIRCTMSSREYTPQGYRWDRLPYPFAKVGGKYDLRQWDDVYWTKLRTFLAPDKETRHHRTTRVPGIAGMSLATGARPASAGTTRPGIQTTT